MNKKTYQVWSILQDNSSTTSKVQRIKATQNQFFGRGMIAGAAIATFVVMVIGLGIFLSYEAAIAKPPTDYLPPIPGIVIDSSAEIPDSIRQASPELQRVYDSSVKAEGEGQHRSLEEVRKEVDQMDSIFRAHGERVHIIIFPEDSNKEIVTPAGKEPPLFKPMKWLPFDPSERVERGEPGQ